MIPWWYAAIALFIGLTLGNLASMLIIMLLSINDNDD